MRLALVLMVCLVSVSCVTWTPTTITPTTATTLDVSTARQLFVKALWHGSVTEYTTPYRGASVQAKTTQVPFYGVKYVGAKKFFVWAERADSPNSGYSTLVAFELPTVGQAKAERTAGGRARLTLTFKKYYLYTANSLIRDSVDGDNPEIPTCGVYLSLAASSNCESGPFLVREFESVQEAELFLSAFCKLFGGEAESVCRQ